MDIDDFDELAQDIAAGIDGEPYRNRSEWERAHNALNQLLALADPRSPFAHNPDERLVRALGWALSKLDPYDHDAACSPMQCVCGYGESLAALEEAPAQ